MGESSDLLNDNYGLIKCVSIEENLQYMVYFIRTCFYWGNFSLPIHLKLEASEPSFAVYLEHRIIYCLFGNLNSNCRPSLY